MANFCSQYPRLSLLTFAIGCALTAPAAWAVTAPETADSNAQSLPVIEVHATAMKHDEHAPTRGSLKATQPKSIIGQDYIQNSSAPTANYSDIAAIAPSVVDIEPNGPGLGNSKGLGIRGFSDGQYNLTWDGVPVGDANDFTHHSSDYFLPQDLGAVTVDRGPGDASTIGYATFGGTVGINTKDPLSYAQTTLYGSVGSFGTRLGGIELDTGTLPQYGDLRAFIDYKQLDSDGYLSGATLDRKNLFMKAVKPSGDDTTWSFVSLINQNSGGNAATVGATSYPYVAVNNGAPPFTSTLPGQIQVFGPNYGLSSDPRSQAYAAQYYNYDTIKTDFEYIGVDSMLGDVKLDNKLYTYSDYHNGWNGLDPNGGGCDYGQINCLVPDGTFPAGADTPNGTVYSVNDIPGQQMYMRYRNWGDILRFSQILGPGTLDYGMWYNRQLYHRFEVEIDLSDNGALNNLVPHDAYDRWINGIFDVAQPYMQYAWAINPQLTLTGGVKYVWFRRSDDAPINQKTEAPSDYSQTWKKALPSLDLHYMITPEWSAYAQAAKGFLAPNENLYYVPDPGQSAANVQPEQTTNYQIGTVFRGDRLSMSADVYDIDFSNQVKKTKIAGVTYFQNIGGTRYRGAEMEGSYLLGDGFSIYANASYNKATENSTDLQLAGVPTTTAAAGLQFHEGAWRASLLAKYTGSNFGDTAADADGNSIGIYQLPALTVANFNLHYTFQGSSFLPRGSKFGFQVFNLTDTHKLDALAGYTANNVPLFYVMAGRSVMGTLSIALR
jgi:iron complex outermembrane recepter protein